MEITVRMPANNNIEIKRILQVLFLIVVAIILTTDIIDKYIQKILITILWIYLIIIGYKKYKNDKNIW